MSLEILFVARLFPDQDHPCGLGSFAENGLRRFGVKVATVASLRGNPEQRQRPAIRKEPLRTRE